MVPDRVTSCCGEAEALGPPDTHLDKWMLEMTGPCRMRKKWCEMICFITITLACQKRAGNQRGGECSKSAFVMAVSSCPSFFASIFLLLDQLCKIPDPRGIDLLYFVGTVKMVAMEWRKDKQEIAHWSSLGWRPELPTQ